MFRFSFLIFAISLTTSLSSARPPEMYLPDDLLLPFPREPESVNLAHAIDHQGNPVYLYQTLNNGSGNREFFLFSHGEWRLLFSGNGFTTFGSIVDTRVVVKPDGTIVSLFGMKGTISGVFSMTYDGAAKGPLLQVSVTGIYGDIDATVLSDGNVAIATTAPGLEKVEVVIWDGSDVVQSFFSSEISAGYLGEVAIAEKLTGDIALATWQTSEAGAVRTYDLIYLEGAAPFTSPPAWSTVYTNAQSTSEINFTPSLDLAIHSSDQPFLVHFNGVDDNVMASRRNFLGWQRNTIDAEAPRQFSLFAFVDDQGDPAACWHRRTELKPYCSAFTGFQWSTPELVANIAGLYDAAAVDGAGFLRVANVTGNPVLKSAMPLDVTDLDGDGVIYVLEDAFQSNPDSASSRGLPDFTVSNAGTMAFTFKVPDDTQKVNGTENGTLFSASENLVINIQLSDDLKTWTQDSALLDTDLFTIAGQGRVVVTEQVNDIGSGAKRYMRVGVFRER